MASHLVPEDFAAYALARRTVTIAAEFSCVPLGLALAREIALRGPDAVPTFLSGGGLVALSFGTLVAALVLPFTHQWADVLFGDARYAALVQASVVTYIGAVSYSLMYAVYRGQGRIRQANQWEFAVLAAGPLCIAQGLILAGEASVSAVTLLLGLPQLIALVPVFGRVRAYLRGANPLPRISSAVQGLIAYGLPRVPTGLAFAVLFGTGPFISSSKGQLLDAGYLVAGQWMLSLVQATTHGFSVVALPHFAHLSGVDLKAVRERVVVTAQLVFDVGLFGALHGLIWADVIVWLLLGPKYTAAIPVVAMSIVAVPAILTYSMFRSIVDAIDRYPRNAIHLMIGAATTVLVSAIVATARYSGVWLAAAFAAGFYVIAGGTIRYLSRRCEVPGRELGIASSLAANALAAGAAFGLRTVLAAPADAHVTKALQAVVITAASAAVVAAMWYVSGRAWLRAAGDEWI